MDMKKGIGFSQTLNIIWLKPILVSQFYPPHKWDGN